MHEVDEYIAALSGPNKAEFVRIGRIVQEIVPQVEQGVSYAMPAYLYKGKALLSTMVCKKHLGMYPYSGKVIAALQDLLQDFVTTTGSIHFSAEHPLPEELIRRVIEGRMREIESKS